MRLSIGALKEWAQAQAIGPRLRGGGAWLLDALYPRQPLHQDPDLRDYAGVRDPVQAAGLTAADWAAIRFLTGQECDMCARPFEGGLFLGAGALCEACTRKPFPFRRGRAACLYDETSKGVILAFKHADRLDLRPLLSGWLSRAGAELMDEADAVVPVPLHWRRLFQRRYNQAAELARPFARRFGREFIPEALTRTRYTSVQHSRARTAQGRREDRFENVKGAFTVTASGQRRVRGRRVVLVDDVFTSGATLSACATALLEAGARSVDVLVLARAVPATGA